VGMIRVMHPVTEASVARFDSGRIHTIILHHSHFQTRHDSQIPHYINDIRKDVLTQLTHNSSCCGNSDLANKTPEARLSYTFISHIFSGYSTTVVTLLEM
jgi:hypothetical protein